MTINTIYDARTGFVSGLNIIEEQERQQAVRLGAKVLGNKLTLGQIIGQVSQGDILSQQISILNKTLVLPSPRLSRIASNLIWIPFMLAAVRLVLENSNELSRPPILQNKPESFKHKAFSLTLKTVIILSDCWGPICLVGGAVSSVALVVLGNTSYAAAFLLVIAVRLLETKVRHTFLLKARKWHFPILKLATLPVIMWYKKGEFVKPLNWIKLASNTYDIWRGINQKFFMAKFSSYEEKSQLHLLSFSNFLKFLNLDSKLQKISNLQKTSNLEIRIQDVTVDREHIFIIPFPKVPNPSSYFSYIGTYWDSVTWDEADLIEKIKRADRFSEFEQSNLNPQQFTKRLLDKLVTQIREQSIETGAPLNYAMLQNKLGFIGQQLQSESHSLELKKTALLNLALDGGDMCGTGVDKTVSKSASLFLSGSTETSQLPLKQRLLNSLEQLRIGILEKTYLFYRGCIKGIAEIQKGVDSDVHSQSAFDILFGPNFGIVNEGALNDVLGTEESLQNRIFLWSHNRQFHNKESQQLKPEHLWQDIERMDRDYTKRVYDGYTPANIINAVRNALRDSLISKPDIYVWAKEWYKATNPTLDALDKFEEALTDNQILEENLVEGNTAFTDAALIAMLVDMGILKLKETSSS